MFFNQCKNRVFAVAVCFLFTLTTIEGVQAMDTMEPLPRDLEIELALSSLPPHLRENATVYALELSHGYQRVRDGANGFHALVARTSSDVYKGNWAFTEYPDDLLIPIAYDSAGAKENMRPLFDMAKMRAEGVAPEAARKMIQNRYESGFYKAPERAGISYMLSPVLRAYMDPEKSNAVVQSRRVPPARSRGLRYQVRASESSHYNVPADFHRQRECHPATRSRPTHLRVRRPGARR